MRAFVAVEVPQPVRSTLDRAVAPVRESCPEVAWTPPERWHLTLTFLAELPEDRVEGLVARLRRAAARTEPFDVRIDGAARFGHRIVHGRVTGELVALRRLADRTAAASRRCGLEVPEARYRPHVTLARARRPTDLRPLVEALGTVQASWSVDHMILVRSTPGAQPKHEVLAEIPFA